MPRRHLLDRHGARGGLRDHVAGRAYNRRQARLIQTPQTSRQALYDRSVAAPPLRLGQNYSRADRSKRKAGSPSGGERPADIIIHSLQVVDRQVDKGRRAGGHGDQRGIASLFSLFRSLASQAHGASQIAQAHGYTRPCGGEWHGE